MHARVELGKIKTTAHTQPEHRQYQISFYLIWFNIF